jgi:hypothetical protein
LILFFWLIQLKERLAVQFVQVVQLEQGLDGWQQPDEAFDGVRGRQLLDEPLFLIPAPGAKLQTWSLL